VLGGTVPSISASNMNDALNAINVGFDKGKALVTQTTSGTCASMPVTVRQQEQIQQAPVDAEVSVYPNPYTNKVNFIITSPVA
ncbi:MAG: hypothetical protein J7502_16850, partial [Flavisolibacter sp.]|nr:hypothetical protein [Flavisolibacter sp.]